MILLPLIVLVKIVKVVKLVKLVILVLVKFSFSVVIIVSHPSGPRMLCIKNYNALKSQQIFVTQ